MLTALGAGYAVARRKRNRKLLDYVNDGYDVMYLYMMYDGVQAKEISDTGFRLANTIIDRCEMLVS